MVTRMFNSNPFDCLYRDASNKFQNHTQAQFKCDCNHPEMQFFFNDIAKHLGLDYLLLDNFTAHRVHQVSFDNPSRYFWVSNVPELEVERTHLENEIQHFMKRQFIKK